MKERKQQMHQMRKRILSCMRMPGAAFVQSLTGNGGTQ